MKEKIIIAIDGHSSCGKSTMAKELARKLGYIYVDTGAMYRALTLYCLQKCIIKEGKVDIDILRPLLNDISISFKYNQASMRLETYLNDNMVEDKIRSLEVSENVSIVAAIDFVRESMVKQQQYMGRDGGVVMDGRDIGTTVFPNAELKIFVTASAEVRAKRRYLELVNKAVDCKYDEVLANVIHRDQMDSTRAISPLRKADDALVLDNSELSIEEQNKWLLEAVNNVLSKV